MVDSYSPPYNNTNAQSDLTVLANASCVLMGMFLPTVFASLMTEFTMHLVSQQSLLEHLDASGKVNASLDSVSIAQCDGISCDANSGRWLLVQDLDQREPMHIIVQPTYPISNYIGPPLYFLEQAFTDAGDE